MVLVDRPRPVDYTNSETGKAALIDFAWRDNQESQVPIGIAVWVKDADGKDFRIKGVGTWASLDEAVADGERLADEWYAKG